MFNASNNGSPIDFLSIRYHEKRSTFILWSTGWVSLTDTLL